MEYCVNALNEASTSGSASKLDPESCEGTVWLLGIEYKLPDDAAKLLDDVKSKIWITYRKNFPALDETTRMTSDRGFGCMIRCGQMVLANALLYKNLGRGWRWSDAGIECNPQVYFKTLQLFQDKDSSPYSIHNVVRLGEQEGKQIGEWYGPNTIAQMLKRLSNMQDINTIDSECLVSIDAALDNVVAMDEVRSKFKRPDLRRAATASNGGDTGDDDWLPGVLFIQLRLGLSKINQLYFHALEKTFEFKNSLGIIGGRPNHALYLIGKIDDDIVYLDPHITQPFIDLNEEKHDVSYHCTNIEKMPIDRLDPSLALCFYFNSEQEFDNWCELCNEQLIKSVQAPMFEITKTKTTEQSVRCTLTDGEFSIIE